MSEPAPAEDALLRPRVLEVDLPPVPGGEEDRRALGPQVIVSERSGPIARRELASAPPGVTVPRRRDRIITFGFYGVAVFLAGWLAVDAVEWVAAAFARSSALGVLAALAVTAGVAGAGAV